MVCATLLSQGIFVSRKVVQRIIHLKRRQCRAAALAQEPLPASRDELEHRAHSNERWATDFTCIWTKYDGLVYVNEVIGMTDAANASDA